MRIASQGLITILDSEPVIIVRVPSGSEPFPGLTTPGGCLDAYSALLRLEDMGTNEIDMDPDNNILVRPGFIW